MLLLRLLLLLPLPQLLSSLILPSLSPLLAQSLSRRFHCGRGADQLRRRVGEDDADAADHHDLDRDPHLRHQRGHRQAVPRGAWLSSFCWDFMVLL